MSQTAIQTSFDPNPKPGAAAAIKPRVQPRTAWGWVLRMFSPLASLRLTVVLFALSIFLVRLNLRPANRDGRKPALVQRWVNLNAQGDPVGGRLQGRPYQVDAEFLRLPNLGCGRLDAACAHGSYFKEDNVAVNRDIFAAFIDRA